MTKLYPPYIEGILPAFEVGNRIAIPYTDNPIVASNTWTSMQLLVRNLINDSISFVLETKDIDTVNKIAYFYDNNNFIAKQHYKVQLAYKGGYYSTVGTIKCCDPVELEVEAPAVEGSGRCMLASEYLGRVKLTDVSEIVKYYEFNIYDNNDNIVATSGRRPHNIDLYDASSSNSYIYYDIWKDVPALRFNSELNVDYYLIYTIITNSNLTKSTPPIFLTEPTLQPGCGLGKCSIENDYDEGRVKIKIGDDDGAIHGVHCVKIQRSEDTLNWKTLFNTIVGAGNLNTFYDYTVEQGKTYYYSYQEFNPSGVYAERVQAAEPVTVDFEDMFLFDGEKQLKLRFNPTVTSFKTTVLETKSNTIGNQYPFIFRNGQVAYKEFPIGGLLTYEMDDIGAFAAAAPAGTYRESTPGPAGFANTTLSNRFTTERDFKLQVLDWLNDGRPKLFRSASEGNYLVRLMNVSLAPEVRLGRMLHTMTAQACEIGDVDYSTLVAQGIINPTFTTANTIVVNQISSKSDFIQEGDNYFIFNKEEISCIFFKNCAGQKISYSTLLNSKKDQWSQENTVLIPTNNYCLDLQSKQTVIMKAMDINSWSNNIEINYIAAPMYDFTVEFHGYTWANYNLSIGAQAVVKNTEFKFSEWVKTLYGDKSQLTTIYDLKITNNSKSEKAACKISYSNNNNTIVEIACLETKHYTDVEPNIEIEIAMLPEQGITIDLTFAYVTTEHGIRTAKLGMAELGAMILGKGG